MQKYLFGHSASGTMATTQGRPIVRDGVRGHIVHVAPKEGYDRFIPSKYKKPLAR